MSSNKVKRGGGLLVVAVISFLLLNVTVRVTDSLTARDGAAEIAGWGVLILSLLLLVAMFGGLVVGLVMIAWGLLRD